jgi:hypothetical protein
MMKILDDCMELHLPLFLGGRTCRVRGDGSAIQRLHDRVCADYKAYPATVGYRRLGSLFGQLSRAIWLSQPLRARRARPASFNFA